MHRTQLIVIATLGLLSSAVIAVPINTKSRVTYLGNFTDKIGAHPSSEPILASDGNYYGPLTTLSRHDDGSIYRLTPMGDISVVHAFKGRDGAHPIGPLIQASDGSLYGATSSGGKKNCGLVFRITLPGTFSVVHAFNCKRGGSVPSGGLLQGQDGNLYGMTQEGGIYKRGTAYSLTLNGAFAVIANFRAYVAGNSGTNPLGELIQASDGTFYGLTSKGGEHTAGALFSMAASGELTREYGFESTEIPNYALTYDVNEDRVLGTQQFRNVFQLQNHKFSIIAELSFGDPTGALTFSPDGTIAYGYCSNRAAGCIYTLDQTGNTALVVSRIESNAVGKPTLNGTTIFGATKSGGKSDDGAAFDFSLQ